MLMSKNVNNGVSKDSPISSDRRFLKSAFFLEQYGVVQYLIVILLHLFKKDEH